MKVLLTVDPEIPIPPYDYGGIERIVDMMVKQYTRKGYEVTLCAHPDSTVACKLIGWRGAQSQNKLDLIKNTLQLSRLVYQGDFDVIHSFSRLAYMMVIMPTSIPKIMSYQREPTVSQVKKAMALSKKNSLEFTGCSNYITNQIAAVATASTVYNCAPFNNYQLRDQAIEDAPLIFLGRIEPIKGTDIAVQVALKSNRRLIIAGNISDGYESYFEAKITPFLSDRIKYVGPVNDIQKNELLGKSLALLMPIMWNEPFGIVMAEAMACGTPVLGFGRGAVPEVISHGINGFVSFSADEMISQVALCASLNRSNIRKIAEERFSDDIISDAYLSLYRQMVHKRNNGNR